MSILNNISNPSHGISYNEIPSLVSYFDIDSINPDNSLIITDHVAGLQIIDEGGASAGWTAGPNGLQKDAGASFVMTEEWPAPGTKDFAIFFMGTAVLQARELAIGDAVAGKGLKLRGGAGEYITFDGSNYLESNVLVTAPTYSFTGAMLMTTDMANNEIRKFGSNGSSSLKNGAGSAGSINQTWTLDANFDTTLSDLIGFGLIIFESGLPSDGELAAAVKHMGAYRSLPPFWKGM